jgi:hypothetical protein
MKVWATFAAAGVAALLALSIGSASASADVLCKENKTPCPAASIYPVGTKFTASLKAGTEATLTAGVVTIKCTKSELEPKLTNAGGATEVFKWEFNTLNFGGCTVPVNVISNGNGFGLFIPTTMNATTSMIEDVVKAKIGAVECSYELLTARLEGGAPASWVANNAKARLVAGKCPEEAKYSATYEFNGANSSIFVAEE